MRKVWLGAAVASLLSGVALPALADGASGSGSSSTAAAAAKSVPPQGSDRAGSPERVVVTARKRKETLFNVPAPVTSISGVQIDNNRLNDARDLLGMVPSAVLQENDANTSRDIVIRG